MKNVPSPMVQSKISRKESVKRSRFCAVSGEPASRGLLGLGLGFSRADRGDSFAYQFLRVLDARLEHAILSPQRTEGIEEVLHDPLKWESER